MLRWRARWALSLGMALQNVPEGAAISLPLQKEGVSKGKAFLYGGLSGVVEPVAGVFGALLAILIAPIMPFTLSFAAGAMIYVVVEELVPEMHMGEHSHAGTAGRDARLCSDDGVGYCAGIVKTCCCLSSRISLKINRPDWMR